jgi:hypothetical protein
MKTVFACCLLFVFAFSSCEEEPLYPTCVVANPVQNLGWLREQVRQLETSEYCQFVQSGTLNGQLVFVLGNCAPHMNAIHSVYDCEGNLLCYAEDETCPNFASEVENLKVLWTNGK